MQSIQFDARALAAAAHDGAALVSDCTGATLLLDVSGGDRDLVTVFVAAVPIQIATNFLFGVYQGIWRYTSLPDIQRIVFAVFTGTVCISVALRAMGLDT